MARKKSPHLTESELRLMELIWQRGGATVAEVAGALPKSLGLAYNTVLTTLRILEEKGYLRHTTAKDSRAFIYIATRAGSRPAVTLYACYSAGSSAAPPQPSCST